PELEAILRREMGQVKASPVFDIRERSSQILTHILHNYSDFAIMTIDSFIHKVIKAFALEIDLPLNFSIVLNYERLESYVIEKLLALVGRDEFITDIILKFVFSRIKEEKSWNIEGDIRRFEKDILSEKNSHWVRGIAALDNVDFHCMIEQLQALRSGFVKGLNELGGRALHLIGEAGLNIEDFAYKERGAAGFLQKCADLREGDIKKFTIGSRFANAQWLAKSAPAEIRSTVENLLAGGLSSLSEEISAHIEQNRTRALTAAFVLDNVYLAAIINRIKLLIDEFKERNGVIPISEFNVNVNEIIKRSPVPFIYAIIGEKYNHYLIDEFQDTSRLQWENLFPLIDNALGSGFFNMAVGDGKQSIYRWRGGDVEIMEEDIVARIHPDQLAVKPLEKNFRSHKHIVVFNNRFFEKVEKFFEQSNQLLRGIYGDPAQVTVRREGGFVSLQFIADTEVEKKTDEVVLAEVNRIIEECRGRGYGLCDIAVLVRKNREGQRVAENLVENNIPVVSPDSLILSKVPLTGFFIDILTYLKDPADKIAEAAIIYFLTLNNAQKTLDPTAIGRAFQEGGHKELTPELGEFFRRRNYLVRMPVYEVFEEVTRIFNLQESLDFNTAGYLQAFLNIISDYSRENNLDIASFLEWWEFNKNDFSMVVPETKPAVRIMTIHKAKGLEFPVVIIPYANWGHDLDKQLWLTPDTPLPGLPQNLAMPVNTTKLLEETYFKTGFKEEKEKVLIDNINLLYVAFTRAGDCLYILAQDRRKNDNYDLLKELAVPLMDKETVPGQAYTLGELAAAKRQETTGESLPGIESLETGDFISNRWYEKIAIRRKAVDFWGFDSYRAERRNWGILVHQVLSRIRSIEDVPRVLESVLLAGDIESAEKEILQEKIAEIFEIPAVRQWFEPGQQVFIEAPIITDDGVLRPDRVILKDGKLMIIDFKTGEKSGAHAHQVVKYKKAIRHMGYQNIDAYLFYLDEKEIQPVAAES
ncbi:MAG: UvrD-helicase domain-containing protein, partial [Candidatus Aminicenantes bacterium]|nr:UvrD-helicase domain-containing protein [Candidatus Aminicenantes bacterium]